MAFRLETAFRGLISNWHDAISSQFIKVEEAHDAESTYTKILSFKSRFLDLAKLLADAQTYGSTSETETEYKNLRIQLIDDYSRLRPFLLAFLTPDPEDQSVGLRISGRRTDAFEAIWASASVDEFIQIDDVFFRDRVGRANQAITDYTEHLNCLLETRV